MEAVDFQTDPSRYKHWRLSFDAPVATLTMDVAEDGGIRPGYKLKLNSYDLGVDIELHDALQRIRFEHPEIRSVIITSAKNRIFCSGANIYMLGLSSHAWKVNFCKFTNETRNGIEDASAHSGLKFLAACNGTTAGGGYELALACDEIILVDDRSSAVSLPELPLLGVLPGTGGLTGLRSRRQFGKGAGCRSELVAARNGARAGRCHPDFAHRGTGLRLVDFQNGGESRHCSGRRRTHFKAPRQLVRSRGAGNDAADVRADRRHLPFHLCHCRAGFLLCRNTARIGARCRPHLHARHPGGRKRGRAGALENEFRAASDGKSSFAGGGAVLPG